MLSPIVEHTSVWEGLHAGKREGEIWRGSPQWTTKSPAAKATNSDSCGRAEVQEKERIPVPEQKRIKKGHSEYSTLAGWTKIEKRNQINTKNYWK